MRDLGADTLFAGQLVAEGLQLQRNGKRLLDIPRLELTGPGPTLILGPNGAGKSLLLRCLHGLIRPDAGTIRQDGQVLNAGHRAGQAMVFQTPVLLRRSVAGNLDYVLRRRGLNRAARRDRIAALLDEGGLTGKDRQAARSLSGGEAQRLAILRALATDPRILFLDEPTSALDPAATKAIEAMVLRAASRGTRIIMVSHDIGQARRLGHDIVLMQAGGIAEQGLAALFFETPATRVARQFLTGELLV